MLSLARGTYPSAAAHATALEKAVASDFGNTPRLIPYLQVHEFEALLFADLDAFGTATGYSDAPSSLAVSGVSPEEINGQRPPSKRILASFPNYNKVIDGALAAQEIGIPAMRAVCPRFDAWLAILGL